MINVQQELELHTTPVMNLLALTRTAQWIITTYYNYRILSEDSVFFRAADSTWSSDTKNLVRRERCKLIRGLDGINNCLKKTKNIRTYTYIYKYIYTYTHRIHVWHIC